MEEKYWRSFWETGKVTDYLNYVNVHKVTGDSESEETRESDYSDRDGAVGISYR